jgi:putative ABC transport system substrate-binding protein
MTSCFLYSRREFIAGLGGAVIWPVVGHAQRAGEVRRIGVNMSFSETDPEARSWVDVFLKQLKELGWIQGHNVKIDERWAAGKIDKLPAQARELLALHPHVILSAGATTTKATQQATGSTAIVFVQVSDPVRIGIVSSLSRPGGNITGFTHFERMIAGKWLELLKEITPGTTRVTVLFDAANPASPELLQSIKSAAPAIGVELVLIGVHHAEEIQRTIEALAREPNGSLVVLPNSIARDTIVELAAHYRLPAIYPYRFYVKQGGLLSFGIDTADQYRRAAEYVDRILKGERPADLPVQAPTKYELVINLKTAKALGLEVPPTLLARADEVIE